MRKVVYSTADKEIDGYYIKNNTKLLYTDGVTMTKDDLMIVKIKFKNISSNYFLNNAYLNMYYEFGCEGFNLKVVQSDINYNDTVEVIKSKLSNNKKTITEHFIKKSEYNSEKHLISLDLSKLKYDCTTFKLNPSHPNS